MPPVLSDRFATRQIETKLIPSPNSIYYHNFFKSSCKNVAMSQLTINRTAGCIEVPNTLMFDQFTGFLTSLFFPLGPSKIKTPNYLSNPAFKRCHLEANLSF
jgi:hypothetical protein